MTEQNKTQMPAQPPLQPVIIADEGLEWRLLCNMIGNYYSADLALNIVTRETFYSERNKELYDSICRLRKKGVNCDMLAVTSDLESHNIKDITPYDIAHSAESYDSLSLIEAAYELEDKRRRREIQIIAEQVRQLSINEGADLAEMTELYSKNLLKVMEGNNHIAKTLASVAHSVYENRGKKVLGIKTGYWQIDEYGGLPLPGFIVIGGGTSQGKSAFVLNLSLYAARTGHNVAYYSLEMPDSSLATRILANMSGVPSNNIRLNHLDLEQQSRVTTAIEVLDKDMGKSIIFDDSRSTTLDKIKQSIRYMKHNFHIDMAVIDHMHILNIPELKRNENQEQQLARAAGELFDISQECGISVVSLAQFNREDDSSEPMLYRLRGSGQIAEAADMVILLYRPEHFSESISYPAPYGNVDTHSTAMCKVAKFRDGKTCKFIMGFDPEISLFKPLDQTNLPRVNYFKSLGRNT